MPGFKKNKPYIYIAYKNGSKRRQKVIAKIVAKLRGFGYDAWFDKEKEDEDWPNRCGKAMDKANAFLLVVHKNTYKGKTLVRLEIPVAVDKLKNGEYTHIIVLIMENINIKKFIPFIGIQPRVLGYKKGWKDDLKKKFRTERVSSVELLNLIKGDTLRKQKKAQLLVQELINSEKQVNLQEGLIRLLQNFSDPKAKKCIEEAIDLLKRKIAGKKPLKSIGRERKPNQIQTKNHKRMLKEIREQYTEIMVAACKLLESLIYLLKEFSLSEKTTIEKIKSLGIDSRTQGIIIKKLLAHDIIIQVGDKLWFNDNNLGRSIMEKVFFSKNAICDFDKIEELFNE